jgi:hypothetical protein
MAALRRSSMRRLPGGPSTHGFPSRLAQPRDGASSETRMSDPTNDADVRAELERLRAENARLKQQDKNGLRFKVSPKGAVSVYGLGRFPVTLYQEQWKRLLDVGDDLRTFIRDNQPALKAKE